MLTLILMVSFHFISKFSYLSICSPKLCIQPEECHVREVYGSWCDWSPWSACELETCSRTRFRECSCPKPTGFQENLLCDTSRYQNDILKGRLVVKHTRLVRKTAIVGVNCRIPFYVQKEYYPDCLRRGLEHVCQTNSGNFEKCLLNETTEMIEEDIGDCEGWKSLPNWSIISGHKFQKVTFNSESELGRKCDKRTPFSVDNECRLYLYYGENQRSDFGKLIDFSYNLFSCKLACSLHPECLSIDFYEGYRCTLNMVGDFVGVEQQIGNKHETKPQTCVLEQKKIDKNRYDFSNVVHVIDANRFGG